MFRTVALVLLVALVGLGYKLVGGQGGLNEVARLKQRVAEQRAENERLKARNDALAAEVEDLKHGDEAAEERARSELGLIKPGETFYQVVEPSTPLPARGGNANGGK